MATSTPIRMYRQLLRTVHRTFAGDPRAISAALQELKTAFTANRNLTDRQQINDALEQAVEAEEFLRMNVIQAVKKDCGAYEISPEKAQQLRTMDPTDLRPPARH